MPQFKYKARDNRGEEMIARVTATSKDEAVRQIRADGRFIIAIEETNDDLPVFTFEERYRKIRTDDVIYFVHQLAVMVDTGVNIGEALDSIVEQSTNEHFKVVLQDVTDTVKAGEPFSVALDRHPKLFPHLMISLVGASEVSGSLGPMLERISEYLTKERNTVKSVRGAMMYPVVMLAVAMGVTIFLLTFVLPRFGAIYANRGAILPAPTRILLGASNFLTSYWYLFVAAIVVGAVGLLWARTLPTGRKWLDWMKLNLPIIGPLYRQLFITRAMRTMGTMVASGVPMLDMVHITRNITRNHYFDKVWDNVDAQLQQGVQLSIALGDSPLMPRSIVRMIHSGEKAGRLGMVLDRVAAFTEHDFDEAVKRATQFIEPAMITIMGGMIGFVAISLLLPIFNVGRVMAGG